MDSTRTRGHDEAGVTLNRILLVGYLILTGLVLVVVATLRDQMGPGEAQVVALILMVLAVADVLLQRSPQR